MMLNVLIQQHFPPKWGYAASVHQSALIFYLSNAVKNKNEHRRYICPCRGKGVV